MRRGAFTGALRPRYKFAMAKWKACLFLTFGLAAAAVGPSAHTAPLHRDLLWATVRLCVAGMRAAHLALPCAAVDLGGPGRPGTAIVNVPGARTHLLLTPTDDVAGLEATALQGDAGAQLMRAALAARGRVVAAAGGGIALDDVGVAVNAPLSRSQDHLHFHLDCLAPATRAALAGVRPTTEWRWLPTPIRGRRYRMRAIPGAAVDGFNPFQAAMALLGDPTLIRRTSLAVAAVGGGGLVLLVDTQPQSLGESVLDHECRIARR
jgi:CDP-diacylglycerol pyrophosphatase